MLKKHKGKRNLKEIKKFINTEATIEDIIEIATVMRDRKRFLELEHTAERNQKVMNKVKHL
ncbi:hypothetical protein RV11_GL000574 [Enterococcus phoeniculicola]|uniref:Uncharacterized protein n=1 Tax=Enterococcus phoeniculicola ATCC BAA-412 TaxID=1158610 RepID=R3WEJ5_9ENTE|nr:hypothetical protein [Enterococcus phoeniculicola]EOL46296.1 hypothetical protein UC3_01102 [Enterococcus phoeniculicola ATCC BAA-412]EOT76859.1 hypothetical protein I589_01820 [Enterococcus phoeniculicola ATCC BAA-412]OJG71284.1 hypothetical protein RV11_GL000574 [Enterococcus phoeniculicola]